MSELIKVLIVDDEMLVRQGIKHILNWEQNGFQIVGEASNGKEALALIEELQPQIVLTDIVMPVIDGEELTRMIKIRWPQIEVIVLSSFSEFEYVRSSFQSGVSDYILKPHLETGMLIEVLRKAAFKIPSRTGSGQIEQVSSIHTILDKIISGYEVELDPQVLKAWLPHPFLYLLGTEVGHQAGKGEEAGSAVHSLIDSLKALFPEMVVAKLKDQKVPGYPDMAVYLLNVREEESRTVPVKLKMLHPSSFSVNGEIEWMLSKAFTQLEQLKTVYQDSLLKLLEYRFFLPYNAALTPNELPKVYEKGKSFQLSSFMDLVRRLQLQEAFQELQKYVREQELDYTVDVFEFKSSISNIIFNVIYLLGSMNYEVKPLDEAKYSYFKRIDKARHLDEIAELLNEFQLKIQECIYAMGMNLMVIQA
ncbi:response regulator [Paenibacillus sp. D2_2]|uniref:response regulator n=1 Tax=Paenibacillus sp. D2_2 TaxID=3073092 RepID=UPI002815283F|nr:response regulator [Paenibacillus sp. D2_2]WMT41931.1 response regulator [Paenibacillus sp. D2_2]